MLTSLGYCWFSALVEDHWCSWFTENLCTSTCHPDFYGCGLMQNYVNDCRMLTNLTILECIITWFLWIVTKDTKPFS